MLNKIKLGKVMTGAELKRFRERQLRMTQEELAEQLGVTVRTLSANENKEGAVSVLMARAVKTVSPNPIPY